MTNRCWTLLALVVGLAMSSAPIGADATVISRVDLTGTSIGFPNDCASLDGQILNITQGDLMIKTHITQSASGNINSFYQEIYQGVAAEAVDETTGDVIAEYRIVGTTDLHTIQQDSGQSVFSQNLTLNFIGKGQAPNITGHTVLHMVMHPDGTVTGNVDNVSLDCP